MPKYYLELRKRYKKFIQTEKNMLKNEIIQKIFFDFSIFTNYQQAVIFDITNSCGI